LLDPQPLPILLACRIKNTAPPSGLGAWGKAGNACLHLRGR
jgi:hypothetical protein